jgi:hypothetical protein
MLLTILPLVAGAVKKRLDKTEKAARAGPGGGGRGVRDSGDGVGEFGRGAEEFGRGAEEFGAGGGRGDGRDWHDRGRDWHDRRRDDDDDGDGNLWINPIVLTIVVWAILFIIAVAVAASCGAGFRDYVVVVLDPFVYLMIRLAVPCGGAPAAGTSVRGMFS